MEAGGPATVPKLHGTMEPHWKAEESYPTTGNTQKTEQETTFDVLSSVDLQTDELQQLESLILMNTV